MTEATRARRLGRALMGMPVLLSLVLLACGGGDSPTAPGDNGGGGGGGGGGQLANGTMTARLNGSPWKATFVVQAQVITRPAGQLSTIQITGVDSTGTGLTNGRQVTITVLRDSPPSTGSFPLGYVSSAPGYSSLGNVQQATSIWTTPILPTTPAGSGTLVVSAYGDGRIRGTFSFTAPGAAGNPSGASGTMAVTEGAFDLRVTGG